ncbi:MAG: TRAP transporter small permease [Rhodovibrionaceae bacterium]
MSSVVSRRFAALSRFLELISSLLAKATLAVSLLFSVGFILCLLLQIFFRYVVNAPLTWTGELAVFLFLWVVLLLASVGVRENFHVRLTVLTSYLGVRLREAVERCVVAAIAAFGVFMVFAGLRFVDLTWGNTSAAISYPLQALYMAAPFCGAAIAIHGLARLVSAQPLSRRDEGLPNVDSASDAGGNKA